MGDIDRIFKENIAEIFLPLLDKYLDISIKSTTEIKDKLQTTIEREPDFLKRVIDHQEHEFILQMEFQTHNDPEMVYRMAEYRAILQRKYKIPVRQFVIYLGTATPSMRTTLTIEEQITGFTLKNIHDFPADPALDSDIPEEIILAVLMDYEKVDAEAIIKKITLKLQQATNDETRLRSALKHLLILSRLRNLQSVTTQKIKKMPITYDITKDSLYLEGLEKGEEVGFEKGEQKGLKTGEGIGVEKNRRLMIINALKIGKLSVEEIAEMTEVDVAYVLEIEKQLNEE